MNTQTRGKWGCGEGTKDDCRKQAEENDGMWHPGGSPTWCDQNISELDVLLVTASFSGCFMLSASDVASVIADSTCGNLCFELCR